MFHVKTQVDVPEEYMKEYISPDFPMFSAKTY
jgi:hypothetical protein